MHEYIIVNRMPKFYCEYCDLFLAHSSIGGRRQHCIGRKHIQNKIEYFQKVVREMGPLIGPPTLPPMMPMPGLPFPVPQVPGIPMPPTAGTDPVQAAARFQNMLQQAKAAGMPPPPLPIQGSLPPFKPT